MTGQQKPQLLTRVNCHLCEDAKSLFERLGVPFKAIDVDSDSDLQARFGDAVPVVLLEGRELLRAPFDGRRLTTVLESAGIRSAQERS